MRMYDVCEIDASFDPIGWLIDDDNRASAGVSGYWCCCCFEMILMMVMRYHIHMNLSHFFSPSLYGSEATGRCKLVAKHSLDKICIYQVLELCNV